MSKKIALKKGALTELKAQLGMDSDEEVKKHIIAVHAALALDSDDEKEEEEKAEDEIDIIEKDDVAEDEEDDKDSKAEDEDKDEDDKKAMDAALIAQDATTKVMGIFTALKKVEPLVGALAMDGFSSASDVYAYALKQKGVSTKGINEAGLAALVDAHSSHTNAPKIAQDSSVYDAPSDLFKNIKLG